MKLNSLIDRVSRFAEKSRGFFSETYDSLIHPSFPNGFGYLADRSVPEAETERIDYDGFNDSTNFLNAFTPNRRRAIAIAAGLPLAMASLSVPAVAVADTSDSKKSVNKSVDYSNYGSLSGYISEQFGLKGIYERGGDNPPLDDLIRNTKLDERGTETVTVEKWSDETMDDRDAFYNIASLRAKVAFLDVANTSRFREGGDLYNKIVKPLAEAYMKMNGYIDGEKHPDYEKARKTNPLKPGDEVKTRIGYTSDFESRDYSKIGITDKEIALVEFISLSNRITAVEEGRQKIESLEQQVGSLNGKLEADLEAKQKQMYSGFTASLRDIFGEEIVPKTENAETQENFDNLVKRVKGHYETLRQQLQSAQSVDNEANSKIAALNSQIGRYEAGIESSFKFLLGDDDGNRAYSTAKKAEGSTIETLFDALKTAYETNVGRKLVEQKKSIEEGYWGEIAGIFGQETLTQYENDFFEEDRSIPNFISYMKSRSESEIAALNKQLHNLNDLVSKLKTDRADFGLSVLFNPQTGEAFGPVYDVDLLSTLLSRKLARNGTPLFSVGAFYGQHGKTFGETLIPWNNKPIVITDNDGNPTTESYQAGKERTVELEERIFGGRFGVPLSTLGEFPLIANLDHTWLNRLGASFEAGILDSSADSTERTRTQILTKIGGEIGGEDSVVLTEDNTEQLPAKNRKDFYYSAGIEANLGKGWRAGAGFNSRDQVRLNVSKSFR